MSIQRFRKILIANRGEIAVRVLRSCRELGIRTTAIYSTPDRAALHVRMADEAYEVGPAAASGSYLNQERILEIARDAGADAVHPGYGFLSENAAFAEACASAGVVFIGPPPEAIRLMGDKTAARALMSEAGVPMAPGTLGAVGNLEEAAAAAEEIGYPILIKAAGGGGGKGMRIVEDRAGLQRAMEMASSEARSAFGDARVFIEKYLREPRHIEFQVLADGRGNVVHLFERECSIQRRHQKVVEESPSSVLTEEVRVRMGEAAVAAARSCGYVNAGTVEFLLDADLNYYFMEMNTRLQVEHPVTEWITGIDLVAEQIRIAAGEELGYEQTDIKRRGHAIECRIYAEDPMNDFLPDPGVLLRHAAPSGFGVRVDSGVEEGGRVEIHYDPMISKLTTWGSTRDEAIRRMLRSLDEYQIAGVQTTIPFCRFVMGHESFVKGDFSTQFVDRHFSKELAAPSDAELENGAVIAAALYHQLSAPPAPDSGNHQRSAWQSRRAG
ncbi:MAG: acetyl-CoA carboxylase biotin carboxylase subunit [Rhodothermales bacterium]